MLDEHGVDMQVVTLTTPGTHVEKPATAVRFASMVNDEFKRGDGDARPALHRAGDAAAQRSRRRRSKEFERATRQLGMRGAMLFSNINGVALSDERFWPIYEAANDLGAVLYIHPTHPVNVETMSEYWLMPLVGFLYRHDAGRRVARLQRRARALPEHQVGARAISAARFRIWPSGSTAASTRSRTAARTSIGRRARICKEFYYDTRELRSRAR